MVNRLLYLYAVWALLLCNACTYNGKAYVIRGQFPGLQDGMSVLLVNTEIRDDSDGIIAVDTVKNGRFELRGAVASPVMCNLWISDKPLVAEKKKVRTLGTRLFLDNSEIEIKVPCFDSLYYISEFGPSERELATELAGGVLQADYNAYRRAVHDSELEYWTYRNKIGELNFNHMFYPGKYEQEEYSRLFAEAYEGTKHAGARLQEERMAFVAAHGNSPLALYIAEQMLARAFTVTEKDFNELVELTAGVKDSVRMPRFKERIGRARNLCKNTRFSDVNLYTEAFEKTGLAAQIRPGRVTLIDCWASWCAPCRAAIPALKALYKQYGDRLDIISISFDETKEAWQKALEGEKMPWPQFIAGKEGCMQLADYYNVYSIPNLILVNTKGEVVFSSNLAEEVKIELESIL